MLGTLHLGIFIASGLLLNITPGADILYITSRGAGQGAKAGVIAALGIGAGCLVHILFAAFGLSVVLATSALAFMAVKLAGAAYLVYLGVSTLLSLRTKSTGEASGIGYAPVPYGRIFRQAILVNILNPKVALFFMAFLPQFVSPQAAHPALSFLFLGCLFNVNGTIVNIIFALCSARIAGRVKQAGLPARLLKGGVGSLFIWLGIRLVMTAQK